jgi:hypothetical protein
MFGIVWRAERAERLAEPAQKLLVAGLRLQDPPAGGNRLRNATGVLARCRFIEFLLDSPHLPPLPPIFPCPGSGQIAVVCLNYP